MKIAFLDTETTHDFVTPERGQICQLAYLLLEDGLRAKNFFFSVREMSEGSGAVTGLSLSSTEELSGGSRFGDFADEIAADLSDALVCAHGFAFDYAFLQTEFGRLGRLFRYREELCTAKYFAKRFRIPREGGGYRRPGLAELTSRLGLSETEIGRFCGEHFSSAGRWHDARFDVSAVCLAAERTGITAAWRNKL